MTNRMEHIVFINHYADEDLYDCVHVDFVRAADRAIRHLQSLGYTHLGYIGGKEREHYFEGNAVIEDERQTTFMKECRRRALFIWKTSTLVNTPCKKAIRLCSKLSKGKTAASLFHWK